MNWMNYSFSEECEPEIQSFLRCAKKYSDPLKSHSDFLHLLETLLPKPEEKQEDECINITESDDESDKLREKQEEPFLPISNFDQVTLFREKLINETGGLFDGVIESLQEEHCLSEDLIQQLGNLTPQQLRDMFTLFSKDLVSECILYLWKSICESKCADREFVATYFSHSILRVMLPRKDVVNKELLPSMFKNFPNLVVEDVLQVLTNTRNSTELVGITKNLEQFSETYKKMILKQFLKNNLNINQDSIGIILCLISKNIDLESLSSIVAIIYDKAKEFSADKTFGRLILKLLQMFENNIMNFQTQFKHIIENHNSIYQAQIIKLFYSILENENHNVTLNVSSI
ncbi:hypothetical protein FQA39_LY03410 [Lamprigera yunnana]|nr:hypothetical protein FQA39_LY03410 [Lamprigera yunnana]